MATTLVSLRIDNGLLEHLKSQAEAEHRTLSNMIISILDNPLWNYIHYDPKDVERWFAEAALFLSTDSRPDAKDVYWNFCKAREACYPLIYPDMFSWKQGDHHV